MRKLVLGLPAVLAAALLVGCGGGGGDEQLTKAEYEEQVTSAARELATSFEKIGNEAESMTRDVSSLSDAKALFGDLAGVVAKAEDNLRAVADELDTLSPPDDAKEANDKLVAGLDAMADDFGKFASTLEDGSIVDIAAVGKQLQDIASSEGGKLIQEAIGILEKAGYSVSDLG